MDTEITDAVECEECRTPVPESEACWLMAQAICPRCFEEAN